MKLYSNKTLKNHEYSNGLLKKSGEKNIRAFGDLYIMKRCIKNFEKISFS
jgi:hypothetical protein